MSCPNDEIWQQARSISQTVRLLRRRIMARHGQLSLSSGTETACPELTLPQLNMLMAVRDLDQGTIKELAEALGVSAPSASTMVERLVEMGLVTREQSQVDRREVLVRLAPDVDKGIDQLEREILHSIVEILETIGPEYARMWCRVYAEIEKAIKEEDKAPNSKPAPERGVAK